MSNTLKEVKQRVAALSLKMIADGLRVAEVYGTRLLIKTVKPYTELDRYKAMGLAVPETADVDAISTCGVVIKVGFDLRPHPAFPEEQRNDVPEVGDMVMFSKFAGHEFSINGPDDTYRIVHLNDIICKLEEVEGGVGYEEVDEAEARV